jgi:3'-phosphoadenosine 5'-phosphosulfate (PAPS) 3'-phosphatase
MVHIPFESWDDRNDLGAVGGLSPKHEQFLDLANAVGSAVSLVRERFNEGQLKVETKPDGSLVTDADKASHRLLCEVLPRVVSAPVISEEDEAGHASTELPDTFWVIDPVDNTSALVRAAASSGDVAAEHLAGVRVFAALVHHGAPLIGAIGEVGSGRVWLGIADRGVFDLTDRGLERRVAPGPGPREPRYSIYCDDVIRKDPPLAELLTRIAGERPSTVRHQGLGAGLKALLEGAAEFLVEPRAISLWDVAAFGACLVADGGAITGLDGRPLNFSPASLRLEPFVARRGRSDPAVEKIQLLSVRPR